MKKLETQISTLYSLAHELFYLGTDNAPVYSDDFIRLNREVLFQANALYMYNGFTDEQEALLCLTLLMSYHATVYSDGDKEERVQSLLNRCSKVLERLSASHLKCQLLVACYGEVFDEKLSGEAHSIMDSWLGRELTGEECEVMERLRNLEEFPYLLNDAEE